MTILSFALRTDLEPQRNLLQTGVRRGHRERFGFLSVAREGDAAALNAVGSAVAPVVFTSAAAPPAPGDWECIRLGGTGSQLQRVVVEYGGAPCEATGARQVGIVTVSSTVDHAVFKYAGNGSGCTGGNTKAAIVSPADVAVITNTLFRNIDGAGIASGSAGCGDALPGWCNNGFEGLSAPELICGSTPTACP